MSVRRYEILQEKDAFGLPVVSASSALIRAVLKTPHAPALYEMEQRGLVVRRGRNQYDLIATLTRYLDYARAKMRGRKVPAHLNGASEPVPSESELLKRAQRELVEVRKQKLLSQLIPVTRVEACWAEIMIALRQALLVVPGQLQEECPDLSNETRERLEHLIRTALHEAGGVDEVPLPSEEYVDDAADEFDQVDAD